MSEQELEDLCKLLRKLLINNYYECGTIDGCNINFTVGDVRVYTQIKFKFKLGDANE